MSLIIYISFIEIFSNNTYKVILLEVALSRLMFLTLLFISLDIGRFFLCILDFLLLRQTAVQVFNVNICLDW